MTNQEFIDAIKSLTVLELNDLVKACEEEFGVIHVYMTSFCLFILFMGFSRQEY